jgi:hypothetical protein
MEKIVLKDNTEIEIKSGASLGSITAVVVDFAELGTIAGQITTPENLDSVRFKTDNTVTGEYTGMKLETPIFKAVDIQDGKVLATFSIREKTEIEKRLDALESGQQLQDGAIGDLGNVVSDIVEGGNA